MSALLPAERCAACEGSHLPGRRIVAGHRGGVLLRGASASSAPDVTSRLVATPDGPRQLLPLGPCWTSEALARAESDAGQGRHPWLCQRCLRFVCRACGGLWDRPVLHEVLGDDGQQTYVSSLGVAPRCLDCRQKAE